MAGATGAGPGGRPGDDDLPPLDVQVPDDARELDRDLEALRRERRAQARRSRLSRLLQHRSGLPAPPLVLVLGALLLAAVPAALLALLTPRLGVAPPAAPLARTTASPGTLGGLLPEVAVRTPGGTVSARALTRPGVLALVPPGCGCDDAVRVAVDQTREFTSVFRLVVDGRPGPEAAQRELERLRRGPGRGLALVAVDPQGALHRTYRADGLVLVVVRADGVVADLLRDVRPGQRLEPRLSVLRGPL